MLINRSAIRRYVVLKGLKKPSHNHPIFARLDKALGLFIDQLCESQIKAGKKRLDNDVSLHPIEE